MAEVFSRLLSLEIPPGQSAFLWGARKTGKSTLLRSAFPRSLTYDFLKTDLALSFGARPALLREQLLARSADALSEPIILDEVQKVPGVLDEVHWLIEHRRLRFILCGSSARKLRHGAANLLAGRLVEASMPPFLAGELGEAFSLARALQIGLVPLIWAAEDPQATLAAYASLYLQEEVQAEALVRQIGDFSRFLEVISFSQGCQLNLAALGQIGRAHV